MNFIQLLDRLAEYSKESIVFVGLGNEFRSDDNAGLMLLNRLKETTQFQFSKFISAGKNPENHLDQILKLNPEVVVFLDAAEFGGLPGEIKILNDPEISTSQFSTHTFSIKIIEKFLLLNQKMDFIYLGIQYADLKSGNVISQTINSSINNFFVDENIS